VAAGFVVFFEQAAGRLDEGLPLSANLDLHPVGTPTVSALAWLSQADEHRRFLVEP
jgi:hypothetical protein